MAKQQKEIHKVKMTDGKRAIIQQLFQEYDIESASDIQDALKDLLGGTIKEMMETEMDSHLGYEKSQRSDNKNSRNGYKTKNLNSSYGSFQIEVPQDRESSFEPQVVKKRQKDISDIDQKIIAMYAKGMTTRQISETINDIYGFEASEGFISDVTDKILPKIEEWQNRPLASVYPIVFIDAIHFSVRQDSIVSKLAAYVVVGINDSGRKEVLTLEIGENESSKYWLGILNSLKNRGVQDVLFFCVDGLPGFKEAIQAVFPQAQIQRCVIHMLRNSFKYVNYNDLKKFSSDFKSVYNAPNETAALAQLESVKEKWGKKYPYAISNWENNWDDVCSFFPFSVDIRRIMYTTNIIEGLNRQYRKVTKTKSVFPSDSSLEKMLYLASENVVKKWTQRYRGWDQVLNQLIVLYPERLTPYL